MATTVEKIAQEATELTKRERLTLVRLLVDLDQPSSGVEIANARESEIRARVTAVDEGRGSVRSSQTGNDEPLRPRMIVEHPPQNQTMSKSQSTYPLCLPTSVKAEVVRRAKAEGTSSNQFVATAVSEKLAAMNTAAFFAERRNRANFDAFDKIMKRKAGETPAPEDQIP